MNSKTFKGIKFRWQCESRVTPAARWKMMGTPRGSAESALQLIQTCVEINQGELKNLRVVLLFEAKGDR